MAVKDIMFEIKRKSLHLTSLWIPIFYFLTDYLVAFFIYFCVMVGVLTIDILRITNTRFKKPAAKLLKALGFEQLFRDSESGSLSGASYMMVSAVFSAVMLSRELFIIAFSILVISDTVAAIVGNLYGKKQYASKTMEGSLAFLFSSLIIAIPLAIAFNLSVIAIIICCITTTIAELLSNKIQINDNLIIPIVFGFTWELIFSIV